MAHTVSTDDVHQHISGVCFKTGPPGKVGAESEWLVTDPENPAEPVDLDRLRALLKDGGPPPAGSGVTYEPGGQLELSSPALPGPARAHEALATDLAHVDKLFAEEGLQVLDSAVDPTRAPVRQLRTPRYTAMERFFAHHRHSSGPVMMCSTASIQVCLDTGADHDDLTARWQFLHRLGPVLVAAFANSSVWRGRRTGWKSTRWAIWAAIDSTRTRPVPDGAAADPVAAWTDYALAANVMALPAEPGGEDEWIAAPGFTLAEWIDGAGPRPLTLGDLDFHLSTLFPPVRPRGWWELRMIDAVPWQWWPVPVALAAALTDEPGARAIAEEATERLSGGPVPTPDLWLRSARSGLEDPEVAACARVCFDAAAEALPAMESAALAGLVDDYADQYVRRGLSPADTWPHVPRPRAVPTRGRPQSHSAVRGGTG